MKQIIVNNISTWYYITEDGKCYNSKTNKFLRGQENCKNHYFTYNITLPDGSKKRLYAHRLVAQAFLEKPLNLQQNQINHIDGNKLNNHKDNLEWATEKENMQHCFKTELKKMKHVFCFNKEKKLVAEYPSIVAAARAAGIAWNIIQQELAKEVKTLAGGFYWSYEKQIKNVKNYPNLSRAKKVNQYDLNGKYINTYSSTGEAARSLGVKTSSHIGECCRGKIKQYKGFIWRYSEDIVLTSLKDEEK